MFSDIEEEGSWLGSGDSSLEELLRAQYRVLRDIGEGGFAEVKLAQHLLTHTFVAIKVIPKTKDDAILNMERDLMRSLDHPNVIKLYEIIETDELVCLVLEYAERGNLQDLVDTVGCMWEEEARSLFRQITHATCYCHNMGIAHRDLKLDNILLDAQGKPKLCDFGLGVRCLEGQRLQMVCGTLPFCAPEILTHESYDGTKADVWSLGVVLYTLVVGRPPFRGITTVQMEKAVLKGEFGFPAHVSADFRDLVTSMVAVDPKRRPSLQRVLEHPWLQQGVQEPPAPESHPPRPDLSILEAMAGMGYDPQQVKEALSAKSYNALMGVYLMLEQKKSESGDQSDHPKTLHPAMALTGALSLRVPPARSSAFALRSFARKEDQKAPAPDVLAETKDSGPHEDPAESQDSPPAGQSYIGVKSRRVWKRLRRCLTWLRGLCCCLPLGKTECRNKVVPVESEKSEESEKREESEKSAERLESS
ncbi:PREDICTED: sperm motility kinase-like [Dipodomys ordii]|uniref:non-specific serine/threonine protein kinase n=1 Tax=Dipodomys ordii TaxID=10020 RepID=A0A1S3GPD9_DIPOR|nr:PREDICTED: sperm motility kinase-like [Dipodomys ordii]